MADNSTRAANLEAAAKAKAKAKPKAAAPKAAAAAPAPAAAKAQPKARANSKDPARDVSKEGSAPAPKPAPKKKPLAPTRAELVRGVFDTFDRDCDDLLNPIELRAFADSVGFEGDEADWVDWYRDTCTEVGANRKFGVDRAQFLMLTKDADDEDLQRLCGKRKPQASTKHALTLRALFDVFDRDRDGFLNRVELRRFMENLDFEGSLEEWEDKYNSLCRDVGSDPAAGVDRSKFGQLSERNATDGELDILLTDLDVMADMVIAVDVWSKLQPKKNGMKFFEVEPQDEVNPGQTQTKEPPMPVMHEGGRPLKPQEVGTITPQKRNSAAKLDLIETELLNLRGLLTNQKPPNVKGGPRMQAAAVRPDQFFNDEVASRSGSKE